ncbi:MAG: hypothetical protein KDD55_01540 [Bdellovibrionales bacterium]|nr:hypothetical protein [Bdellovibrionales bacterium]
MFRWSLLFIAAYCFFSWFKGEYLYTPPEPTKVTLEQLCADRLQDNIPKDYFVFFEAHLPPDVAYFPTGERAPKYSRCGPEEEIVIDQSSTIDISILHDSLGCPVLIRREVGQARELLSHPEFGTTSGVRYIAPTSHSKRALWVLSRVYDKDELTQRNVQDTWSAQGVYRGVLSQISKLSENRKDISLRVHDLIGSDIHAEVPDSFVILSDRPIISVPDFVDRYIPLGERPHCALLRINKQQLKRATLGTVLGTVRKLYDHELSYLQKVPGLYLQGQKPLLITYKDEQDFDRDAKEWANIALSLGMLFGGWALGLFALRRRV